MANETSEKGQAMRFSAEWWTGFGIVFAALGTIMVAFCWWMDRRIARFDAKDAEARERLSRRPTCNVVEMKRALEGRSGADQRAQHDPDGGTAQI